MTYSSFGVWLTIQGSRLLTLWSTSGKPQCLFSYEVGTNNNHVDDFITLVGQSLMLLYYYIIIMQ